MTRFLRFALVVSLGVTWGASDSAAQIGTFTGRWRVDHAAGNPPSKGAEQIWVVTEASGSLTIAVIVNDREVSRSTWPLGGTPVPTRREGLDTTSATVGGGELVIVGEGTDTAGGPRTLREQWIIDPDTKALRVAKVITAGASTFTRHLVLHRIAAPATCPPPTAGR